MADPLSGAPQQGHNLFGSVTQAEFLGYIDRYADADRKVSEAVADRKDLRAAIKSVGVPLAAFDRARRDMAKSGDLRETEEAWYRRMMAWSNKPVGFQPGMDYSNGADAGLAALNVHALKAIDNEGYDAGKAGHSRDSNSYTPGTEAHQRWDAAWLRGQGDKPSDPEKRGRGRPPGSKNRPKEPPGPDDTRH